MSELPNCANCGHPADWHRHDDTDTDNQFPPDDPRCKFRCIGYDCESDGPIGFCQWGCPDYHPTDGAVANLRRAFAGESSDG